MFLNDCELAHPIVVQEIPNGDAYPAGTTSPRAHQVILYAGNQVIGIRRPFVNTLGGAAPGAPVAAAEYPLELFNQRPSGVAAFMNDVFELDGDSIILASSRPCISTDSTLCAPPPPQLVVQVQNGRGTNGTPLVVGPRNLADSEFWDFLATDNSGADPTSGFVHVATADQLWNAVCASPMATNGPPQNDDGTLAATCARFNAGWGSVIVITSPTRCDNVPGEEPGGPPEDVGFCIDMSKYPPLVPPAGVTLRGGGGGRRGINLGPQLYAAYYKEEGPCVDGYCMIVIHGDYVRITGLRLRGQSRIRDQYDYTTQAIEVDSPLASVNDYSSETEYIAMIDHNDISDWESATVNVNGGRPVINGATPCPTVENDQRTQDNVRIARNFLHHNERASGGYGSLMAKGGRAFIVENTFLMNRHAIAADGEPHEQYRAWYNLVLSGVPRYTGEDGEHGPQQDFDMHGTAFNDEGKDTGYGAFGGSEVDIAGNTFLGPDRPNFELRGLPCVRVDYFRDNVTRQQRSDIIYLHNIGTFVDVVQQGHEVARTPVHIPPPPIPESPFVADEVLASHNQYRDSSPGFSDPTASLKVGDFDGDGVQDLFLATGTAWYYSPGGTAEWRFLSAKTDKVDTLLFGDFDGDGRTDVVGKNGNYLLVSWGGTSDWELLNREPIGAPISDLAVGNFVDDFAGDRRDDIFWANGAKWQVSSGGSGPFKMTQTSSFRVRDLRFGDFIGDQHTDVFGVQGGKWSVSDHATGSWTPLPVSLTNTVDGLIVADLGGNARAEITTFSNFAFTPGVSSGFVSMTSLTFMFWQDGLRGWSTHQITPNRQCGFVDEYSLTNSEERSVFAAMGRFNGKNEVDILLWNGYGYLFKGTNEFCAVLGGTADAQQWSRQDMR